MIPVKALECAKNSTSEFYQQLDNEAKAAMVKKMIKCAQLVATKVEKVLRDIRVFH